MRWPDNITEAKTIQDTLKKKIRITPLKKNPRYIAGVDAAFFKNKIIGVACLYRYPEINYPAAETAGYQNQNNLSCHSCENRNPDVIHA